MIGPPVKSMARSNFPCYNLVRNLASSISSGMRRSDENTRAGPTSSLPVTINCTADIFLGKRLGTFSPFMHCKCNYISQNIVSTEQPMIDHSFPYRVFPFVVNALFCFFTAGVTHPCSFIPFDSSTWASVTQAISEAHLQTSKGCMTFCPPSTSA